MVLSSVCIWSAQNGLILNPAKCVCMYITATWNNQHQDDQDLALGSNGARITLVDELKILGVSISSDLQWTVQARKKRQSITKMLGVLNRFGCSLNTDAPRRVFNAFVMPKVVYCLPAWCHVNKGTEKAMDHVLLRAAGIILSDNSVEFNESTYKSTGILLFKLLAEFKCLLATHSLLQHGDVVSYLPALFTADSSHRSTRSIEGRKFKLPRHSNTSDKQCFYYMAAKYWNNLPFSASQVLDNSQFFKSVNAHILSHMV